MSKRLKSLYILLLLLTTPSVFADQLQIGDSLPTAEFIDQHNQTHKLDSTIQLVIFAHTKETGSMMTDLLAVEDSDYLVKRNAIYIADISGMPSLIARFFALPKLRKIDSPIYLVEKTGAVAWLPREDDKLTLLMLSNGIIEKISFIGDKETMSSMLEAQ